MEVLVTVTLSGLLFGIGILYLDRMNRPLDNGAEMLAGFFRQARAKAMATTSAYRIRPIAGNALIGEYAGSCSDTTWTVDGRLRVDLPDEVSLVSTNWSECFTSRGIAAAHMVVGLDHPDYGSAQVEVLMGGAVTVLP